MQRSKKSKLETVTMTAGKAEEYTDDEDVAPETSQSVKFASLAAAQSKTSRPCWGCDFNFAKPPISGVNPVMDDVYGMYEKYFRQVSEDTLVNLISEEQQEKYVLPLLEEGQVDVLEWMPEDVRVHLRSHRADPDYIVHRTLTNFEIIEAIVLDTVQSASSAGGVVDYQATTYILNSAAKKLQFLSKVNNRGA